ncbi:MAG: hypothetical protein O7G31_05610 [Calditrichaeota bacterium]|nr:hypothetical protein [Calditrichota bacterium]
MASITSWTRLESRTRSEDMRSNLQAQIHDPVWLLARQWQFGEFHGEDAGSPVTARVRIEHAPLTRYHPGPLTNGTPITGQAYDARQIPLETLVERESIRNKNKTRSNLGLSAEAGLNFLRLLDANGVGRYRKDYIAHYVLQPLTDEEKLSTDGNSLRFMNVMAQRVPDGIRLYQDLNAALGSQQAKLPAKPAIITAADNKKVINAAKSWLTWYESLFSESENDTSPWISERMEYTFAVSAPTSNGEVVLAAPEYQEGHLDWYSFDLQSGASLGAKKSDAESTEFVRTVIPAPVSYKGMPARRWWEFEDAHVDFGGIEANPEDLSRLLLIQFALSYGNDWFMIPVELEVGAVYRTRSLVITDTFGERTLIQPYSQVDGPKSGWRMFCPCPDWRAGTSGVQPTEDIFFLPPVLANSLHSSPLEEVLFLRDEMANMAWAVERVVESPTGYPLNRFEAYKEQQQQEEKENEIATAESTTSLAYRLATTVPDYWTPLLPIKIDKNKPDIRLQRGRLLRDKSGELVVPEPLGRVLEPGQELSLFEEEVPRAGAQVTRSYQYARWIDGSTHLWIGRRKRQGHGEGWSGLRFDVVEDL